MFKPLRVLSLLLIYLSVLIPQSKAWAQSTPKVVISQVYGGGGNGSVTYTNDFIELFNPGATNVSLDGWSVQYASATGTTWQVTRLSGSIAAGRYYLVQQAAGTGGTTALPTPNATGTIAMSATAGKVALVNSTTALTTACPTTNVIDFVGFGTTANCFEGAGPTPAPSSTVAVLRAADGCTDTDKNNSDFATGAPNPRNSGSPANVCGTPSVTLIASATTGSEADQTVITLTASASAPVSGAQTVSLTVSGTGITTADYSLSTATITIADGATTGTAIFTILDDQESEETETAVLTISNPSGGLRLGSPVSVNIVITDNDAPPQEPVKINTIQGNGAASPLVGTIQTIEGVVTRTFTGSTHLNGFYVQEEDRDADSDPATSEGIFIFDPNGLFKGNPGDLVRITGKVLEFRNSSGNTLTQLAEISAVNNLGVHTLPAPVQVQLPVVNVADLERYEGMLVQMSAAEGNLTVTEHFQLGRFGQVTLAAIGASNVAGTDARLDQYTQFFAPSVSGYSAYLQDIALRRIVLDDGRSGQNPDPIIFARGGQPLSATNTLRGGDQVTSITAILDDRFEGYRLQTSTSMNFIPVNTRPATPPEVGGNLKVGSFNLLNYFNGNGTGGGFPIPRGANNLAEFNRQRDKTISAIVQSGVDLFAFNEMENDGYGATSAIQDLVNGVNAVLGNDTYAFINPGTSTTGTDLITVAMIYKPSKLTPEGAAAVIPNSYGNGAFDAVGRKPLAQTFRDNATGALFTVVANHWKSKGSSSGGAGDTDAGDGQGASNGTRTRQAEDLASWLATNPTGTTDPDYLILGDLNAYAMEDPLTTLKNAGYNNLLPNTTYSYVFNGFTGSLDHALGSASMTQQVSGAAKWHINADEPNVLDYNTEFKTAGQVSSLYNVDPFRTSDHDPVIVGLTLTAPIVNKAPVITQVPDQQVNEGNALSFTVVASDDATQELTYTLEGTVPEGASLDAATGVFSWTPTEAQGPAEYTLTLRVTDNGPGTLFAEQEVKITVAEVNTAPVLADIADQQINAGSTLTLTASATDTDLPANTLTYSLVNAPAGAQIDAQTGAFSWTPTTGGRFTITVQVTDNGSPALSAQKSFQVTVNVIAAPQITSFTPASGNIGIAVTITGTNLLNATGVSFNGTPAQILTNSATQIITVVPEGATTGQISVTTVGGTATSSASFRVTYPRPVITSFSPASGPVGTRVTINGSGFYSGVTTVKFNSITATQVEVLNNTTLVAVVPAGTRTGKITVSTPGGNAASQQRFTVTLAAAGTQAIEATTAPGAVAQQTRTTGALSVRTFPNPFTQSFTIQVQGKGAEKLPFQVYNSFGQVVLKGDDLQSGQTVINGRSLMPGVYYLQVGSGSNRQRIKLVKTGK